MAKERKIFAATQNQEEHNYQHHYGELTIIVFLLIPILKENGVKFFLLFM